MTPAAAVYLLGHAVQYAGLIAQGISPVPQLRYVTMAGIGLQVIGAILSGNWRNRFTGRALVACLALWVFLQAIVGYYCVQDGTSWSSYYASDVVVFGLVLSLFMGSEMPRVARLYLWILPVGLVVSAYMASTMGAADTVERFKLEGEADPSMLAGQLCTPALFLALVGDERWRTRILALSGCMLMALFGLLTSTRFIFVAPVAALLGRIVFLPNRRKWVTGLAVVFVGVLAISATRWGTEELSESVEALEQRLFDQDDLSSGRNEESEVFFDLLSPQEIAIGKGLGGSYIGVFVASPYGINMVHYGALHLVLKGGVVLLALFSLTLLLALIQGPIGARLFLGVFLVMNVGHTQFSSDPTFALAMLSAGACLCAARARVRLSQPAGVPSLSSELRPRIAQAVRRWWYPKGAPELRDRW